MTHPRETHPRDETPAEDVARRGTADVTPGTVVRTYETKDLPEGGRVGALWFGVLGGAVAFLVNLQTEYTWVPRACGRSQLPLHIIALLALAVALAATWVGHREWERAGRDWPDESGTEMARSRFMGALGFLTSALFALVIVAQWMANFILGPCD